MRQYMASVAIAASLLLPAAGMTFAADPHTSGTAGQPERAVPAAFDVLALLGVEKDSPGAEVSGLDDPLQLVLVTDEDELALRGGRVERVDDVLVVVA